MYEESQSRWKKRKDMCKQRKTNEKYMNIQLAKNYGFGSMSSCFILFLKSDFDSMVLIGSGRRFHCEAPLLERQRFAYEVLHKGMMTLFGYREVLVDA